MVTGDRAIALRSVRKRLILAILLCHSGEIVSVDRLIDALWDGQPPETARQQLRVFVYKLRRDLGAGHGIEYRAGGYRIRLDGGQLDAERFEELARQGDDAAAEGDVPAAALLYGEALALWRGPALGDLAEHQAIRGEAVRLDERRLTVLEARIDADLARGRHREVVEELATLVAGHPLREPFRGMLMMALARCGRQGEALQVYQDGGRLLADELGVPPGPDLRRLHQAIVSGAPHTVPSAAAKLTTSAARRSSPAAVPRELPSDVATFTGRSGEVEQLVSALTSSPPRNMALSGTGGVGKSALAVHVAHKVAGRFPDGQLYLDLHGSTPGLAPVDVEHGLARLLRSLGFGHREPMSVDEAAARFRTVTADKKILVVLDNVADVAQIRPLVPGGVGCAVLVTGRRHTSLDGFTCIRLAALAEDDAVQLLGRLIGAERAADGAVDLVWLCGRLPLAVAIAAARLNARPGWGVRELVARLESPARRLDELTGADRAVRTSFLASYAELTPDAARMFRLLSVLDTADISTATAAALGDVPDGYAEDLLDQLTDAQLIDNPVLGRYRLHDLLRLFARERAIAEEPEVRRAQAVRRALHCYLASARSARRLLAPEAAEPTMAGPDQLSHPGVRLASHESVGRWIDAEVRNLVLAARQAIELPGDGPAIAAGLAEALSKVLPLRSPRHELMSAARIGLEAARRIEDPALQARMLTDLGYAEPWQSRADAAAERLTQAASIWPNLDDPAGFARTLNILGMVRVQQHRAPEAIDCFRRSRDLYRQAGYRAGQAAVLTKHGCLLNRLDRFAEAIELHRSSLALSRDLDDVWGIGVALCNLGETYRLSGAHERAIGCLQEAVSYANRAGDRFTEAEAWWGLGQTHHAQDRSNQAQDCWRRSVTILREIRAIDPADAEHILTSTQPETPDAIKSQR